MNDGCETREILSNSAETRGIHAQSVLPGTAPICEDMAAKPVPEPVPNDLAHVDKRSTRVSFRLDDPDINETPATDPPPTGIDESKWDPSIRPTFPPVVEDPDFENGTIE